MTYLTPVTNFYDIGRVIRELRKRRKLTGEELGKIVGMSQSKISKLENGNSMLTVDAVEKILNILQCPTRIQQQISAIIEIDTQPYGKYRFIVPNEVSKREARVGSLCSFLFSVPHVLLQTTAYRELYLRNQRISESEMKLRLAETLRRQEILWDNSKRFDFLMAESSLYTSMGNRSVQLSQIDKLRNLTGHQRIRVGIIPYQAGFLPVEHGSFVLYDRNTLITVVTDVETISHDAEQIAEHLKVFTRLQKKAVYGAELLELLNTAQAYFTDLPEVTRGPLLTINNMMN